MRDLKEAITDLQAIMRTLGEYMVSKGLDSTESMPNWLCVQYVLVMIRRIKDEERTPERLSDLAAQLNAAKSGIVEEVYDRLKGERGILMMFEKEKLEALQPAIEELHAAMTMPMARAIPGL